MDYTTSSRKEPLAEMAIKSDYNTDKSREGQSLDTSSNILQGNLGGNKHGLEKSNGESERSSNNSCDPEEDVCFPLNQEENNFPQDIDFDELEFFAGLSSRNIRSGNKSDPISASGLGRKYSIAQAFFNDDLSPKESYDTSQSSKTKTKKVYESTQSETQDTDDSSVEKSYRLPLEERRESEIHRFSFFHSGKDYTVHASNLSELREDGESFKSLFSVSEGVWWLDSTFPTDLEMKVIANAFSIHPLTTEDIKTQEPREKVEVFKNYYFLIYRSFEADPRSSSYLEPVHMYMVVFKGGILSFHFGHLNHPANVRRRIRQLQGYVSVTANWISYALIDDITDAFIPVISSVESETDAIEEDTLVLHRDEQGDMLRRVGECRRKVMQMTRLLQGKADVIKMFSKRCNEQWNLSPTSEIGLFLGDIQDHLVTMTSNLTQFETILARSHSNYLAYLSVDAIRGNNAINAMLGKITLLGTVLVPMNVITGLFGMNVQVPGQDGSSLGWFFGIVGIILLIVTLATLIARRTSLFYPI